LINKERLIDIGKLFRPKWPQKSQWIQSLASLLSIYGCKNTDFTAVNFSIFVYFLKMLVSVTFAFFRVTQQYQWWVIQNLAEAKVTFALRIFTDSSKFTAVK
jgi:hypothetical protein